MWVYTRPDPLCLTQFFSCCSLGQAFILDDKGKMTLWSPYLLLAESLFCTFSFAILVANRALYLCTKMILHRGMGFVRDRDKSKRRKRRCPCENQRELLGRACTVLCNSRDGSLVQPGGDSSLDMNCKETGTLIFPVSRCALHSWHPADKLVLMAMGYKAVLTVFPGCLSQRESSAFPKFYDLKVSGTKGRKL